MEVGIVTEGTYYLEVTNTRPNRLDFDFSKVLEKNKDNQVFYVQYCYARTVSYTHLTLPTSDLV